MTHLPGYVANADKIKEMGVDGIICLSVNDIVRQRTRWEGAKLASSSVLADGNGIRGLASRWTLLGLEWRCGQRYADRRGRQDHAPQCREGPGVDVSSAENMMALL